jgi:lysophospholipase L1-like esterase
VVALGDSTSCGEGVGLRVAPEATWPALLTAACPGAELLSLATAGAGIADVRRLQLPQALAAAPDVVTLLIGLNDLSRAGFDRQAFAEQLCEVVLAVRATGAVLLLGRLHDASLLLPLPPGLRDLVRSRTAAVNAAVDACAGVDVRLLDLAAVRPLRSRRVWDVDRVHPNGVGHALIAAAAADVLRELGCRLLPLRTPDLPSAPGPAREVTWLLRHGLPWLATHVPQVVLPAVLAAVRPGRPG